MAQSCEPLLPRLANKAPFFDSGRNNKFNDNIINNVFVFKLICLQ